MRERRSHGTGQYRPEDFARLGQGVVIEPGVLIFHPENIEIGDGVYVGHQTILKGYFRQKMRIGKGTWIGQQCFLHSAGGLEIGDQVGIGPGVKIITSAHTDPGRDAPIIEGELSFGPVRVGAHSDIGVGAILLPGVEIGEGSQIGAGAVVTRDVEPYSVMAGVPARLLRKR